MRPKVKYLIFSQLNVVDWSALSERERSILSWCLSSFRFFSLRCVLTTKIRIEKKERLIYVYSVFMGINNLMLFWTCILSPSHKNISLLCIWEGAINFKYLNYCRLFSYSQLSIVTDLWKNSFNPISMSSMEWNSSFPFFLGWSKIFYVKKNKFFKVYVKFN